MEFIIIQLLEENIMIDSVKSFFKYQESAYWCKGRKDLDPTYSNDYYFPWKYCFDFCPTSSFQIISYQYVKFVTSLPIEHTIGISLSQHPVNSTILHFESTIVA